MPSNPPPFRKDRRGSLISALSAILLSIVCLAALVSLPKGASSGGWDSRFIPYEDWSARSVGGWQMLRGERSGAQDRWEPLDAGAMAGLADYEGTLWLRRTVPELPWRDPYFVFRNVQGLEAFIDGRSVYAFNPDGRMRYVNPFFSAHPVRLEPQDAGKELTLRLPWDRMTLIRGWNAIGERSVFLAAQTPYDSRLLLYAVPLLLAGAVSAFLFARRRERIYMWFALFALSAGAGLYWLRSTPQWFGDLHAVYYWRDMAIPLGILGFVGFYAEALGATFKRIRTAAVGFWLAYSIATAIAAATDSLLYRKLLVDYIPYCIVPVFSVVTVTLIRHVRTNRTPSVRWLLTGYGVLVASFLNHIVMVASPSMATTIIRLSPNLYNKLLEVLPVGLLVFMGCLVMVLVQRFLDVYRQSVRNAEELAAQHETLVRMDRLKDDFLRTTSHELRTPLHGIAGLTESLIEGAAGPLDDRIRADLRLVLDSSKRLLRLVNDILDLYRLKHSDIRLQPEAADLRRIAGVVLAMLAPAAKRKGLHTELHLDEVRPFVWADPNRLEQMLYNLVGNAVKYTDSGVVTVKAERVGAMISISVEDTGRGIAPDQLDVLYEPFAANDGTGGGTGLGLSITKNLVELSGGTIEAKSEVGRGTVVTIRLPAADEAPEQVSGPESAEMSRIVLEEEPETAAAGATMEGAAMPDEWDGEAEAPVLLLVDDEPVNIRVLHNYLQPGGYRLVQAKDGPEALALLEGGSVRPDLVLLDVMMPDMTGYEVCRRIRERWGQNELPVILLSARNRVADLAEGFDSGANDYLPKPFAQRELFARVGIQLRLLQFHRSLERLVEQRTKELEEANRSLAGSVRETAEALAELSVLEERNRIAHEIHDVVGHTMTAAIVQLEAARKLTERDLPKSIEKLENAQRLVRRGLNDIRQSVRMLKDEGASFDLVPAMKELIRETEEATGVVVDASFGDLPYLNGLTRRVLYHALQEGLTNGIRHGRCRRFEFDIRVGDGDVRMRLSNDGLPFADAKPGFGLTAMMERVHLLGGSVRIGPASPAAGDEGEPDGGADGCRLAVTLPVTGGGG
ncbi:ATP-binding protein [Paenibacillus flagellatus]|uniref:Oxygen sensor histidine kinase NreB n=1 Tax=Paenibacillus flagellatus TaxID=2211139 RepID=A0A2V5JVU2_9BACL|nr:ATP-binding protein [Paenibacillus flagellatus]PYI50875.1 histidine kinase [Paenibacillus flagellatus]